jgi:methylated-DNA-[protein]-cysteine S-methyltransferase
MNPIESPLGPLWIAATEQGISRVSFRALEADPGAGARSRYLLDHAREELDSYFAGEHTEFSVPVDLRLAEPEQRAILGALDTVPYGTTTTYGALASMLRIVDDGPRRVGAAMAHNPVLIIVPCHRVIGKNGSLTGYAGGLHAKRVLLAHEALQPALATVPGVQP